MAKTAAGLFVVLAAWSMPCAAIISDGHRGVFSDAGSFHSAAAPEARVTRRAAAEREPHGALLFVALGLLGLAARRRWLALRVDD
jgi:hypothetical protein